MRSTRKKIKTIVMLFVICIMLFSQTEEVAAVELSSSDIVNYVNGRVNQSYPNGYCLKFVEECYQNLGANRPYNCCAYKSGSSYIVSSSSSNIPDGATVYFGNCGGGPCGSCGATYFGHVGIYVGNGYFVHASGGVVQKSTISSWSSKYRGWGYCGNFTLKSSNNPSGSIDSVAGGVHTVRVGGWAYDADDTSKALEIHVYVGGEAGSGAPGYVIGANKLREDVHNAFSVGKYHGFDEEIVVETYGTKDVYIYAINVGGGGNVCLGKRTVTIAQGPGTTYEDLGTNFYAKIFNTDLGTAIANQNGYATSRTNQMTADRLWKFERQADKSYKIINCLDGTVLDVDHALTDKCTKVLSCTSNGNSNQRWFINKNGHGYSLMPAHAYGMALDIWMLSSTDGTQTVICPWTSNDKAEIFKINKATDLSSYYGKVNTIQLFSDSERKNVCTQIEEGGTVYFTISGINANQFNFVLQKDSQKSEKVVTAGDYSLKNLKLGTYTLKVTPINAISSTNGTVSVNFKVVKKLTSDMVVLNTNSYIYDGSSKKPSVTVKTGTTTLIEGADYSISYANNTNAGTATVTVTGTGNYVGTVSKQFTINKANQSIQVSDDTLNLKVGETASVAICGHGTTTYSSSDTSVVNVNSAGIITGQGSGSASITVKISGDVNYNSTQKMITVTVEKAEKSLKSISITSNLKETDYYIGDTIDLTGLEVQALFDDGSTEIVDDYEVNTEGLTNEAGKKTIMVAYLYNGVWKTAFLNITVWEPDIRLSNSFFDMNIGEIKGVSLGASPSGVSIIWESSNSEVATVDNGWIEALSEGTATITASFVYNGITYKDSMTIQVQPNENEPPMEDEEPNENEQPKEDEESSENEVPKEDEQPDKNEPSKEEETSHQGGVATCHTLAICDICGDEYGELNFANHDGGFEIRNSLTATEENEGYTGDVYCLGCNIKIVEGRAIPKLEKEPEPIVAVSKVKISKLTNSKGKKVKVVIKKAEEVTGYQLTYSTNNKFKKAKTKSVNKNQYTIKNLKKGKRYYIKVRAYKQVDGKIYYGEWSKVKQIKVKK